MKKTLHFLTSMFFTGILLVIFAIAIGYATFVENDYGTITAKILIYNSAWFEVLLFVIVLNLTGSILVNKLISKKKWTIFLFHVAFIVILAGAALTRFFSFEGSMHIRDGETTNKVISDAAYVGVTASQGNQSVTSEKQVMFSGYTADRYSVNLQLDGKKIHVQNMQFMPSASETIVKDINGQPFIALVAVKEGMQRVDFSLNKGKLKIIGGVKIGFDNEDVHPDINFSETNGNVFLTALDSLTVFTMISNKTKTVAPGELIPVSGSEIYRYGGLNLVFEQFYPNARVQLEYVPPDNNGTSLPDAFLAKITVDDKSTEMVVSGKNGETGEPQQIKINGVNVAMTYGSQIRKLPFSIKLNHFQLDRYPGSNSPSSYASEVVLTDQSRGIVKPFRIYMNNILKYDGYRFFQSSYDTDEKGTILSVNYDQWGTSVTYFGYLIMAIGMILTLFSKNSRFRKLVKASAKLHAQRKKLFTVLILGLTCTLANAQTGINNNRINKDQVSAFSELLIQNNKGRIEPVNTIASEILRKVAQKSTLNGMPAAEVFLDMNLDPDQWKNVPLIKVANARLRKILGANDDLIPFNQIVQSSQAGGYKLSDLVQQANEKKPVERNKFDKEIINVDERVNILMEVFSGNFLTIFPIPGHPDNKWVSLNDAASLGSENATWAKTTLTGYFSSVRESISSGDWRRPNGYLKALKENQDRYGASIIPARAKIILEVFYNNFNIFGKLALAYFLVGFILLIIQFITIFNPTVKTDWMNNIWAILAIILFAAHSSGLAIRWYISGHAPWSNGYESMIFIGWATVLAGIVFIRRSQITLALTLILASLALLVAGMSWMSPEITNLVPVLKSYWLIVHVAIITASYGFLGICTLLGALILILMIFRTEKNVTRINYTIKELAFIIQMAMIIGLFMLTVGSFIGGVWANESWGRYWGWDPKETWALVTILVYSFVVHMHKIPGFRGTFALSTATLVGFGSVMMTYFGVNYYLSGMHSYAQGEAVPVPSGVYITVFVALLLVVSAYITQQRWNVKTKRIQDTDIDMEKL